MRARPATGRLLAAVHAAAPGRWLRRRRRWPAADAARACARALVALLLALFEPLQRLVDAHRQELDHQVRHAQTAFEFLHRLGLGA